MPRLGKQTDWQTGLAAPLAPLKFGGKAGQKDFQGPKNIENLVDLNKKTSILSAWEKIAQKLVERKKMAIGFGKIEKF